MDEPDITFGLGAKALEVRNSPCEDQRHGDKEVGYSLVGTRNDDKLFH